MAHDLLGTFGGQAIAVASQLAVTFAVARLLLPSAVGVYAASVTVIGALTFAADLQVQASAIRATGNDHALAWSAGVFQLVLGSLYAGLIFGLGPAAAQLMGMANDRASLLLPILHLSAAGSVVTALGAAPTVLLSRRLRLRELARGQAVLSAATAMTTILLAIVLHSAWALPIGALGGQVAQLSVLWWAVRIDGTKLCQPRRLDRASVAPFLSFGSLGLLLAALTYAGTNADNVAVARLFGATSLGAYILAYNVARSVDGNISVVVSRVLFPTLAGDLRSGDRARLTTTVPQALGVVTGVSCVIASLIFLAAPVLTPLLLSPDWYMTGTILQILALDGLFAPVVNILGNALLSAGMLRPALSYSAIHITLMVVALLVLPAHFGVAGVAAAEMLGGLGATVCVCVVYAHNTDQPISTVVSRVISWAGCLLGTATSYLGARAVADASGWSGPSTGIAVGAGAIMLAVSTLLAARSTRSAKASAMLHNYV